MAYKKQNFESGAILFASQLNHIEDGIVELEEKVDNMGTGGGIGLTTTQKSLMITLFRNMLSQSDMSATVDELENSFNSGSGGDTGGDTGGSGEDEPITPTTYTVKYNLTNTTSSNSDTSIDSGNSFTTTLAANDGYVLGTVIITMGGIEITDTVYDNGVIYIPKVSGNIVINVVGVESGVATNWEDGVPYTFSIVENEYVSKDDGTFKPEDGNARTDYIPCYGVDVLFFSKSSGGYSEYNVFYDENKNFISKFHCYNQYVKVPTNASYFVISDFESLTSGEATVMPLGYVEATWEDGVPYTFNSFIENTYIDMLTGGHLDYNGWKSTDKLNCANATKLTLSTSCSYSAFYDKLGNFIKGNFGNKTEVTVPVGATHFAVSNKNDVMDSLVITPYA